jgi:hypothetical protein
VIEDVPIAGTGGTYDYCDTDTALLLWDLITGPKDDIGTWSGSGTSAPNGAYDDKGTGSDPTDDTFDPSLAGAGTYVFTYTVTGNAGANGCVCADSVATVTINVTEAFTAGTGGTVTICVDV